MNKTLAAPPASCTATSSPVVRTPAQAVIGTLAYSAAEITSHTIITRRAGLRAVHPRARGQPDDQPGQPRRRGEHADRERAGVQHHDRDERHAHHGHGVAEAG